MGNGGGAHLLIPELWSQTEVYFCEFQASLIFIVELQTRQGHMDRLCLKKQNKTKNLKQTNKKDFGRKDCVCAHECVFMCACIHKCVYMCMLG